MSRQRVRFADNPDNGEDERPSKRARLPEGLEDPDEEPTPDKPYEKKHTLDSDEEDNAEPDNKLDMKKVTRADVGSVFKTAPCRSKVRKRRRKNTMATSS